MVKMTVIFQTYSDEYPVTITREIMSELEYQKTVHHFSELEMKAQCFLIVKEVSKNLKIIKIWY